VTAPPLDLRRAAVRQLARIDGVIGVGCGLKETAGRLTEHACWRVYVRTKLPERALDEASRVPRDVLGWPTDVIARAPARASAGETTAAVADGAMIANRHGVPGTLGCRAWIERTGQPVLLSNYHVLFGKNARRGDPIWRVWPGGAAHRYLTIARVLDGKAETIRYDGRPYFVDAAIGALDPLRAVDEAPPSGQIAAAELGSVVAKQGAATGRTTGRIVDICYPDRWFVDDRSLDAPNQLLIAPEDAPRTDAGETSGDDGDGFCDTGDSGSIVRDEADRAVGLLWGSNARGEGVASHIGPVLHALQIRLEPPWSSAGDA
jgi:endonuclease G, mitochondrial